MTLKTMMRRMMDQMMKTKKILNLNQRKTRRKRVKIWMTRKRSKKTQSKTMMMRKNRKKVRNHPHP
jgi:hypothetical protein